MDFSFTAEDEAFRDELRDWLASQLPPFLQHWTRDDGVSVAHDFNRSQERRRDWQRRLNEGRWAAINWPLAWNGREATPLQDAVYSEEMARVQALAASGIDSTFLRNGRSRETFLSTGGCAAGGSRGSGLGFGTSGARAGTR